MKKLESALQDYESSILNKIDQQSSNTLLVPVEKQINRKQTQILRDKSSENDNLKFRLELSVQEAL